MHLKHARLDIFTRGQYISILKGSLYIEKIHHSQWDSEMVHNGAARPKSGQKYEHLRATFPQKLSKIRRN